MIDLEIKEKKDCMGCYACLNICPEDCISMHIDDEGFWYPIVNYDECINCGLCVKVCPVINKTLVDNEPKAYACYNKDEEIRLDSSSGGIFTLVAEEILDSGGVVFGVGFNEEFKVVHSYTEVKEELSKYRGSKYVESEIGNTYKQAKDFLKQNRNVLFTGTPCQISGLKSYLGKNYDNLFCLDNVCHGVPSPMVWDRYLDFRSKIAGSKPKNINFRLKDEGWNSYSISFLFKNEKEYKEKSNKDLYMRAFLKDVCLRPSCYDCSFKGLNRESDITLADFWGIHNILPDIDSDKGVSLIFVNSNSGKEMLEKIKNKAVLKEVDINEAIVHNSCAIKSVEYNPKRDEFFKELNQLEFDKLVKKHCKVKLSLRFKNKIKSMGVNILKKTGTYNWVRSKVRKNK